MTSLREHFTIKDNYSWFNNCGITPTNTKAKEQVNSFLNNFSDYAYATDNFSFDGPKENIKTYLSKLFQCRHDELAIMHNTAEGINILSQGLSLHENENIILLEDEYPSNYYPWLHWQKKGVEIRILKGSSSEEIFNNLTQLIDKNTKLLSLSAVHWLTGVPLPLKKIGELCNDKNIDFVLDAAQGAGHVTIHPHEYNISFMAFSGWKWLLGPLGLGALYCDIDFVNKIDTKFLAMSSFTPDNDFLPYQSTLKEGAERFNFSTPAMVDWVYFDASLSLLDQFTPEQVQKRLFELSFLLYENLKSLGFQCFDIDFNTNPTAIISCRHPNKDSKMIVNELEKNKIITALRGDSIRFSPHIYNSEEEINSIIGVLRSGSV